MSVLLKRDAFRAAVFARDGGCCVICNEHAVDAHHIMERRLWPDGGYHLDNGASLCAGDHKLAESTEISTDDIRYYAGIKKIILPPHLYEDEVYDKWGNNILPDGRRLRGELFHDESVQKALAPVLHLFTNRVKYPRTYHLPWSPGTAPDDCVMGGLAMKATFYGKEVVITTKMDGENTTMYNDYLHARSLDFQPHPSRSWIKAKHAQICFDIPQDWRVCGENLYAKHTISYRHLSSYFLVFSIWNDRNICLDWDSTLEWINLLGLQPVPTLYRGVWDESIAKNMYHKTINGDESEGYVVRLADSFPYRNFRYSVAKYVRAGHVPVHATHWRHDIVIHNELESKNIV